MVLQITIDIFSGRPNPVLEISGKQAREILERVTPAKRLSRTAMPAPEFRLGYRGLIIQQKPSISRALPSLFRVAAGAIYGPELAHAIADPEFERLFAGPKGPAAKIKVVRNFPRTLQREIKRLEQFRDAFELRRLHWPTKFRPRCRCAPLYEPAWWNDGGQKQSNNNCYNYATNYRTDTFAQPGQANGAIYTALTCASVRPAAIADALIDHPSANNRCPKEGHLVALVARVTRTEGTVSSA
jgi:hypothetical protein